MAKASSKKRPSAKAAPVIEGEVLDVVRALLDEGRTSAALDVVRQLTKSNGALATELAKISAEKAELERRLARIEAFRHKNEGVSTDQLLLFLNELTGEIANDADTDASSDDAALSADMIAANAKLRATSEIDAKPEPTTPKPARQPSLRKPLPEHLERVDNPLSVAAKERPCPRCGKERVCIGHDITEVAELRPATVIVRRDVREKLGCEDCEGAIVRAPVGDKVVTGGRLGPRLVAELLVDKYSDGLPLHRQKERFARMGLDLPVSTLADQVTWATDLLRPVWRAAIAEVLASKVMHLDATGLPVLDREVAGGKRLGALWGYVGVGGANVAAYVYTSTGSARAQRKEEIGPADMLALRSGYTVADASNVFDASFKRPDIIECACNMHARRYFIKALDAGDTRAALPIAAYKKIYDIESEIGALGSEEKLAARQERSRPVFEDLGAWCRTYKPHEPPASLLGVAIRYFTNHEAALGRFLEAAEVPPDNGAVERLHVRAALTRKNFLFAGSDAGGDRAAIAFTILGCCRLLGVNPVDYLADVLPRLGRRVRLRDVPALLPSRWRANG
ncbi:MAG TPA: IS66 family transposase [Labilithrix sp.]|nr:IS66 family transposase [Labilithrix sp.]